jgi:hypothetical protein
MDYILPPGTIRLPYDMTDEGTDGVLVAYPESKLPALTDDNPAWAKPGAVALPAFRFIQPSIN